MEKLDKFLPDFIVIGAMKAGTSSLHHYLSSNPAVFMPPIKEVNFFRGGNDFSKGLDWYRHQFAGAQPGQLLGEASPDYTKHPHFRRAPERIHEVVPDAKLIFLAREPISRMRSQYLHQVSEGRETRPIDVALLEDGNYLDLSRYAMQLQLYLDLFPRSQLLVVASEQLSHQRAATMREISSFLGVPDEIAPTVAEAEHNRGAERREKSPLLQLITQNKRFQAAALHLPAPLKRRISRAMSKPIDTQSHVLSDDSVAELQMRLAEDREQFDLIAPGVSAFWAGATATA